MTTITLDYHLVLIFEDLISGSSWLLSVVSPLATTRHEIPPLLSVSVMAVSFSASLSLSL